jgi:hypothetical protein
MLPLRYRIAYERKRAEAVRGKRCTQAARKMRDMRCA